MLSQLPCGGRKDTSKDFSCSPFFSWIFWPQHQFLLKILPGSSRFVGGAVRNSLQGKKPKDFDIATTGTPQEVIDALSARNIHVIPTGLAHGTVSAVFKGNIYEITTLRQDIETDGRHAVIAYTDSWKNDAMRRDFTMNALYADIHGTVYDETGKGINDALMGCVRFIGDATTRIQEDGLRILRFFRFSAFYGNTIDAPSLQGCIKEKECLRRLSKERVTKEILQILSAPNPWPIIYTMNSYSFWPLLLGTSLDFVPKFLHYGEKFEKEFLEKINKKSYKFWDTHKALIRLTLLSIIGYFSKTLSGGSLRDYLIYNNCCDSLLKTFCENKELFPNLCLSRKERLWISSDPLDPHCSWASVLYHIQRTSWQWIFALLLRGVFHQNFLAFYKKTHVPKALKKCQDGYFFHARDTLPSPSKTRWRWMRRLQNLGFVQPVPISGIFFEKLGIQGAVLGRLLKKSHLWWLSRNPKPSTKAIRRYIQNIAQNEKTEFFKKNI